MSIKCDHRGCLSPARWAPKLCVPAQGIPIDLHKPLSALASLPLCDIHIAEIKAQDMLGGKFDGTALGNEPMKEIFRTTVRAIGGVAPDFDRAFIQKVRLDSDEYSSFKRMLEAQKKGESS